jgi:hypothetical protein
MATKGVGEVYLLTFANGKSYVGLSRIGAEKRFGYHKRMAASRTRYAVYAAWIKYGEPTLKVLGEYPYFMLGAAEMDWITKLNTIIPNGYNMHEGAIGGNLTDRARNLISEKAKDRWAKKREEYIVANGTPRIKMNRSEASINRWKNPEYRKKLTSKINENWSSPDFRDRHRIAMAKPEIRKQMSEARLKFNNNPIQKEIFRSRAVKQMQDPAVRVHLAALAKVRLSTPEGFAKMVCAINTPEAKAKKSASLLRAFANPIEKERRSKLNKTSPLRAMMYANNAKRPYTTLIPGVSI